MYSYEDTYSSLNRARLSVIDKFNRIGKNDTSNNYYLDRKKEAEIFDLFLKIFPTDSNPLFGRFVPMRATDHSIIEFQISKKRLIEVYSDKLMFVIETNEVGGYTEFVYNTSINMMMIHRKTGDKDKAFKKIQKQSMDVSYEDFIRSFFLAASLDNL